MIACQASSMSCKAPCCGSRQWRRTAALLPWWRAIAYRIEHLEDDDGSRVWWEFSQPARRAMQGSDYFAALNRGTLLAFGSRYAVTMYERGCLLAGRRDPRWRG